MSNRYGLEIRAATGVDTPGIAGLMDAGGISVSAADLAERLQCVLQAGGTVLVALEWGPPSGIVVLHRHRTLAAARPVAEITMLLVHPDDRRKGLGRLLLKAAARAARQAGCETLRLCAALDRRDLRDFCRTNGFAGDDACFTRSLRKSGGRAGD